MIGIYKITEIATGLCYIGQSKRIERRWKEHHKRFPLHRFKYEVMIQCPVEDLNRFEVDFISRWDSHRNGFNGTIGGSGMKVLYKSAETRLKISTSLMGQLPYTNERKKKMSENGKGKKMPPRTDEHIANLKLAWACRKARKIQ